jgi:2-keto-4-pentenoate hydratase
MSVFTTRLIEAQRAGTRFTPDGGLPASRDEALRVQAGVCAALGRAGGFKVARTPAGEVIFAPILAERIVRDGAEVPVRDRIGIELEVGFELLVPLDPQWRQAPQDYLRPRVVVELIDTRVEGPEADAPLVKLADMQVNHGLVVGPAAEGWDGADFGTVEARLTCGDTQVLDGAATVPGGSALQMVELLRQELGDHCGGLRPGQYVITGTLSGLQFYEPGRDVRGAVAGLGEIGLRLV